MIRKVIALALAGFGITLALVIGQRMSTDAMAVVIGVVVGVAASVPTSILLVALLRRERASTSTWRAEPPPSQQLQQPNFIVLNTADLMGRASQQMPMPMPPVNLPVDGGMRRLRVVGDEDEWM